MGMETDAVLFRVLGPLEARHLGRPVEIRRRRERALLGLLLLEAGSAVPIDHLVGLLWDDRPPDSALPALRTHISRLRAQLNPGGAGQRDIELLHAGDGYLARVEPGAVDALRFRGMLERARTLSEPAERAGVLRAALGLWRGQLLADAASHNLRERLGPPWAEARLAALEDAVEAEMAFGRHRQLVGELGALCQEHPYRERFVSLLMLALYRCGRQAEALEAFRRADRRLRAELGIDPGQDLRELHRRILAADPGLDPGRPSLLAGAPGAAAPADSGLIDTGLINTALTNTAPADAVPADTALVDTALTGTATDGSGTGSTGAGLPAGAGVPRGLLAGTRMFTGRQAELARLLELAEAPQDTHRPGTVVISAIDGMAGIGKTALAVHAAHRLADRFGDGQLFIDLHGYTQGYPPRTAHQALDFFLRTLGVPPHRIPDDHDARAALYRQRLAGTSTLIVLDNAADEAQIRPLIPGAPGCLVLVTSRRKLKGLDEAHTLALDVLPRPDALALFHAVAGAGRVAADDPAVAEIVGLCGCLPLAVRIAAALLRSRPAWSPRHAVEKLRDARATLDSFFDGDRDLAALFDLSCSRLADAERRLYHLLGLTPGPEIDARAAAALLQTTPTAAERLLQELVDHSLLMESTPGRYRMHDLIRAHARSRAAGIPAGKRGEAIERLLDHYRDTAARADARLACFARSAAHESEPSYTPGLQDAGTARAWLRVERANLVACFEYAAETGRDRHVVALGAGLTSLLRTDGPWSQAMALSTAAAAAAERLGDRPGQARALTDLGDLRRLTGDYPGAEQSLRAALELYRATGDRLGQARVLTELGIVGRVSSDMPGARRSLAAALELYRATADTSGRARALAELGSVQCTLGDVPGSRRSLGQALALYRAAGDRSGQAHALNKMGDLHILTGDYADAADSAAAALDLCWELGDRLGQANALTTRGSARHMTGDHAGAVLDQEAAHGLYRELGDRLGQANARTLLAEVRRATGDYLAAARDLEEALEIFRADGNRGNEAVALNCYAAVVGATGDPALAIDLYHGALRLTREMRQPDDEAAALEGLGESYLREGKIHDGADYLRQALDISQRIGMPGTARIAARLAQIDADRSSV